MTYELQPQENIDLVWKQPCNNEWFTTIVQPYGNHLFSVSETIQKISPSTGKTIWESHEKLGILSRGIYSLHPEIIGIHQKNIHVIVDDLYQHAAFHLYRIKKEDGKVDRHCDIGEQIWDLSDEEGRFENFMLKRENLYLKFDRTTLKLDLMSGNFHRVTNKNFGRTIKDKFPKANDYFDAFRHCFPENDSLHVGDLEIKMNNENFQTDQRRFSPGIMYVKLPSGKVGKIECQQQATVRTLTRYKDALFITTQDQLYNFRI